jgi:hypothetical protein
MKLWQVHRTALIAIAMLTLSPQADMGLFAEVNSPQEVKNIVLVRGAWADGIVLVQSGCAPPGEGFSCGRCAESPHLAG